MAKEPSVAQRKLFAKMGYAMPDGSYYIRPLPVGEGDLENAIKAVGRGENAGDSGDAIRKHIMKRAAFLKLSSKIPDTWNSDGSLKEAAQDAMTLTDFFEHHGVKGMHWGVKKELETAGARAKVGAKKAGGVALDHPILTLLGARVATLLVKSAYRHRGEIAGTAWMAGKVGAYLIKQAFAKGSPMESNMAIGRQVVQGFVVHSDEELNDLTHFGRKGMHWGVRNAESKAEEGTGRNSAKHDKLIQAAKTHEAVALAHGNAAEHYAKEYEEVQRRGLNSAAGKRVYGKDVATTTPGLFYLKNNQTKGQALDQLSSSLRTLNAWHGRASIRHANKAQKLRTKASKLEHDGLNFDPNFDVDEYLRHFEIGPCVEESVYLRHHGIKGMHWGVHKQRGEPSNDHVRVSELRTKVKTGRGVHVLSNDELQDVNNRLNLETSYARLVNGGGSELDKGEKFVKANVARVKTGIDAVETGRRAVKLINDIKK